MPLLGQASGGWTESSSALRLLHVGVRNTVGILTDDAFTQTNPPIVTTAATISDNVDTATLGVLSGSVSFTRPDVGANYIGGPNTVAAGGITALQASLIRPLGLFINTAVGNAYENTPGPASGKGPYVSAQGTYASQLFETAALAAAGAYAQGDALVYTTGMALAASDNGYLTPRVDSAGADISTTTAFFLEATNSAVGGATTIGILKMPSDSTQPEIVFDQRI
jgi:hypothetical protein